MPHSTPSDFPDKYLPGEKPGFQSINKINEYVKSISNKKSGSGIETLSTSSGNSTSVNERLLRPPIWATITNISTIILLPDSFVAPPEKLNACYGGYLPSNQWENGMLKYYAYSWVEVTEDLKIGRNASLETPRGNDIFPMAGSFVPTTQERLPQPACYRIMPIYNPNLNFGTLRSNPAYCVNMLNYSPLVGIGKVVKLYHGAGDYMLFEARRGTYDTPTNNDFEQPWLPDEDHP